MGMIKDLEKIQMRTSKLLISMKHLRYRHRLQRLNIPTLGFRHIREDMMCIAC